MKGEHITRSQGWGKTFLQNQVNESLRKLEAKIAAAYPEGAPPGQINIHWDTSGEQMKYTLVWTPTPPGPRGPHAGPSFLDELHPTKGMTHGPLDDAEEDRTRGEDSPLR